jgi:CRP/FNR family transcriptional regulator, cyclic AMP receptor protein
MENFEVFAQNYLVTGLPPERVREIAELAEYGVKLAGEDLMVKGEKSSDLFVVLEGRVNIYTPGGDKLGDAGPGSVLGEIALVDDQPRSATATCVGLVKFAKFPAATLRTYMVSNKDAGFTMLANLARVLSMRLRQSSAAMEALFGKAKDAWEHAL